MPMDAWRKGDRFVIEFDSRGWPKKASTSTWSAMCSRSAPSDWARNGDWEMLASERPRGRFSRQLVLG